MIRKLYITTCFVFFVTLSLIAGKHDEDIKTFLKSSGIAPTSVAFKVTDLKNGEVIAEHNSELPLVPASIMKSVTTAALLQQADIDWRYHTRIYIDGPIDMGILRGNLIIEGAGDPSINSEYEPLSADIIEEIKESLKYLYITKIEGNIIIDESLWAGNSRPASWAPGDYKKYYGTGSHSFNYNNNATGDFSVENPKAKFIDHLSSRLKEENITIDGKNMSDGQRTQIYDHVSPPLDDIMRSCMMRSDNMFAESMLRTYGILSGGDGSTEVAADIEYNMWRDRGLPLEGVVIVDGSGLSRENRVTAEFMTSLLREMCDNPNYASFFPLAGQEGTLKKFLSETELDSYIAMKTGSMKGIQCYAGYKLDDDYVPTHSVVLIMNNLPANRDKVKKAAERLLLSVFNYRQ